MRVTILGSDTAIASAECFPAGAPIQATRETIVAGLDPGTRGRVAAAGVGPGEISTVLLTYIDLAR